MNPRQLHNPRQPPRTWFARCVVLLALGAGCGPTTPPPTPPSDESATPQDPVEHALQRLAEGDAAGAEKILQAALDEEPDNHELWFSMAVAQQEQGRADDAVASYEKALALKPGYAAALLGLGGLALDAGDPAAAEAHFSGALQTNPDFAAAHYNLAVARMRQGDLADARAPLEAAHRLEPEDVDVLVDLAKVLAAAGEREPALGLAQRASSLAPKDVRARMTHGWLLAQSGDHKAAATEFEGAVAVAPSDVEARLGLARAWVRTGKVAEAAAIFAALSTEVPDAAQIWADWGAALAKLGEFDSAVEKLDEALTRDPKLVAAHVRKVAALAQGGQCKRAKKAHRQLAKVGASAKAQAAGKAALSVCS